MSSYRSMMCSIEESFSLYTYFVTLTYDNINLPTVRVIRSDDGTLDFVYDNPSRINYLYTSKYHYILNDDYDKIDSIMWRKTRLFRNSLPYLEYEDVKLFLKRIRIKIFRKYGTKIRFFVCGEYGPKTFRPHWHILFYFSDYRLLPTLQDFISTCWQLGRVDASLSRSKCASYVAGYVNSNCRLPRIFKSRQFRTRSFHSQRFGTQTVFSDLSYFYSKGFSFFDNNVIQCGSEFVAVNPWRSITSILYPKCYKYAESSSQLRHFSYTVLRTAIQLYGVRKLSDLAELIVNSDPLSNIVSAYFSKRYFYQQHIYDAYEYSLPLHESQYYGVVYRELLVSKRFFRYCCNGCWEYSDIALRNIEEFYSELELSRLNSWYNDMEEYSAKHPHSVPHKLFYDNYDDYYGLVDDIIEQYGSAYYSFVLKTSQRYEGSIKHKQENDANLIFC